MKHKIFISYSDFDKDKVEIIVNELKLNEKFETLVIAFNREALKPLAEKVASGIIQAEIIIPILTKKSIVTQWINQEIGFATALNKKIMPIVESGLSKELKGFIHQQIDLPYKFETNIDKEMEETSFLTQIRNLIKDLDTIYFTESAIQPLKSSMDIAIEEIEALKKINEIKLKNKQFLESTEGHQAAMGILLEMFDNVESKIKLLKGKNIIRGFEKDENQKHILLRANNYCFSMEWNERYYNSLLDTSLLVKYWKGYVTFDNNSGVFRDKNPIVIAEFQFKFGMNTNGDICFIDQKNNNELNPTQIVEKGIEWVLIEESKILKQS